MNKKLSSSDISVKLKKLNKEHKLWIRVSLFVCISILLVIHNWNEIHYYHTEWAFVSIGMLLTSIWWYWVMRVIQLMLIQQQLEIEILNDTVKSIQQIKTDIKNP
jgi:hypothetical protein